MQIWMLTYSHIFKNTIFKNIAEQTEWGISPSIKQRGIYPPSPLCMKPCLGLWFPPTLHLRLQYCLYKANILIDTLSIHGTIQSSYRVECSILSSSLWHISKTEYPKYVFLISDEWHHVCLECEHLLPKTNVHTGRALLTHSSQR
jgi:hypothetical protein